MTRAEFVRGLLSSIGLGAIGGGRAFAAPAGWTHPGAPNLVFGALSDTHLRTGPLGDYIGKGYSDKYFAAALRYLRDQNVDAVVHCGDFAHRGQIVELEFHAKVWRDVFPDDLAPDGHKVEKLFVTGNHDVEGSTYGDFVAKKYPDPAERAKHVLSTDIASSWERVWNEPYKPIWHKEVKGYHFVGSHYGVPEADMARFMERRAAAFGLGAVPAPVFHLQHVRPGKTLNEAVRKWRNAVGFFGHAHRSASNWNVISLWEGRNAAVQIPACDPRGTGALSGDAYIAKAKLEGEDYAGKPRQGYLVKVYDDMMVISRREFGEGGSLGADWILPFGKYDPHPFSRDELKRQIGSPQFRSGAELTVAPSILHVTLDIPLADGNPDSRVYAYDVSIAEKSGGKKRKYRSVYAAGCSMGIGHEPEGGVTYLKIPRSDLPVGEPVVFAARPLSSLGTAGKPISTQFVLRPLEA